MQAPPLPPPVLNHQAPAPGTTSTNPGCVDPASQTFPPASQSCPTAISSSSSVNSNGEMQHGNQMAGNAVNGTVTQTAGTSPVVSLSGEGGQRLDRRPADASRSTGIGIPLEVNAGSVNHSGMIQASIAKTTPPAIDVHAANSQPGGLPATVYIR